MMKKMPIALLDVAHRFFRALARGNVHDRAHELQVARLVLYGVGHDMKMLHRAVRHQQAMLEIEILAIARRTVDDFLREREVVRMHALQHQLDCRHA